MQTMKFITSSKLLQVILLTFSIINSTTMVKRTMASMVMEMLAAMATS
jgi:hypothetical protein